MSYMDNLIQRGRKLLNWDKPPEHVDPTQEQAIQADEWDQAEYEWVTDNLPAISKTVETLGNEFNYVRPAYGDLFQMLHQAAPLFEKKAAMKEGYVDNHALLKQLAESPEFTELRKSTVQDSFNTALTMLSLEGTMRDSFQRIQRAQEQQEQAQQQVECLMPGGSGGSGAGQGPGTDPAAGQGQAPNMTPEQQAALEQAIQAAEQAQQQVEQATQEAAKEMSEAAAEATKERAEEQAAADAVGYSEGDMEKMSFEQRQALQTKLDGYKLKMLADLLGDFRPYADSERRRKLTKFTGAPHDVTLGNDMHQLLGEELVKLAIPELQDQFWLDWANRRLLQWERRDNEPIGRGPIIVVCDESGSMGAAVRDGFTREMWSKAITLSLCDAARYGKRDFIYIGFSDGLWTRTYENGDISPDAALEFATHFIGGGTDYGPPLRHAQKIIEEYAAEKKPRPDIVFITDDTVRMGKAFIDDWEATRRRLGCSVFGVEIGAHYADEAGEVQGSMRQLCDKTMQLTALNSNPEDMKHLYRAL